jgi:lactate permease
MVGRQTPVLAAFVPFALLAIVDGRRGVREAWPAALVAGIGFGIAQFVASNYMAVTGSDTSSNALFGLLQTTGAKGAGLSETLLAAANSSGGVLGKMISPQNLAVASAAIGMSGKEGDIFRKVVGWSPIFTALMCILVCLQSTPVLCWMVV